MGTYLKFMTRHQEWEDELDDVRRAARRQLRDWEERFRDAEVPVIGAEGSPHPLVALDPPSKIGGGRREDGLEGLDGHPNPPGAG